MQDSLFPLGDFRITKYYFGKTQLDGTTVDYREIQSIDPANLQLRKEAEGYHFMKWPATLA